MEKACKKFWEKKEWHILGLLFSKISIILSSYYKIYLVLHFGLMYKLMIFVDRHTALTLLERLVRLGVIWSGKYIKKPKELGSGVLYAWYWLYLDHFLKRQLCSKFFSGLALEFLDYYTKIYKFSHGLVNIFRWLHKQVFVFYGYTFTNLPRII